VVGCAREGDPRGLVDGGREGPVREGPDEGPTGSDGGPVPVSCAASPDCGPDRFCDRPSKTCISAVRAVAAGSVHTCAVHRDGRVSCWGYGPFIGPALPVVSSPTFIELPGRATAVAVGIQAACAQLEEGEVRCWGDLGAGPERPAPIMEEDGRRLTGITRLAGGSAAFCAVEARGTFCWGSNRSAELARPASQSFAPHTAVLALPGPRPLIAATVAILVHDGVSELCGWGNNDSGLVPGPRGTVERPACVAGVPDVLQLTAGDGHVCARRGGARFSCWGSNSGGQLGAGDEDLLEVMPPGRSGTLAAPIDAVEAGAYHTCALLGTGAVFCWGSNEHGECGLAPSAPRFAPSAAVPLPRPARALGSGAGAQHTCAVLDDGSVVCWGYDNEGQLGSGVITRNPDRASAEPLLVRW
jgi:alpha-tubulin suppressor-like RCC1 family protein